MINKEDLMTEMTLKCKEGSCHFAWHDGDDWMFAVIGRGKSSGQAIERTLKEVNYFINLLED